MNNRIDELAKLATTVMFDGTGTDVGKQVFDRVKFAELIVKECYDHCKDQLMDKSLAEEAGLDYNDGVMDCAIGLKQHFGVEE